MSRTLCFFLLFAFLSGCLVSCDPRMKSAKEDYFFELGDVIIRVGDDANDAVERLGQYNCCQRANSCAGIGEDILFIYNGLRISAFSDGNNSRISAIELTSDLLSTPEGVRIGDSDSKLEGIYGEGERDGARIIYQGKSCRLCFTVKKGVVSKIKYIE